MLLSTYFQPKWYAQFITYLEIILPAILFHRKWALGDPYLEAVNLSFIFTWDDGEIEDRTKVSTLPLFQKIVD